MMMHTVNATVIGQLPISLHGVAATPIESRVVTAVEMPISQVTRSVIWLEVLDLLLELAP